MKSKRDRVYRLTEAENGGWLLEQGSDFGVAGVRVGAYTDRQDLLEALAHVLREPEKHD